MSDTITLKDTDIGIHTSKPYNVILFNDENHDMQEVANQIMKAINCTPERAANIMLEAHSTGRAIVFSGSLERCELVAQILEEIRLGTKIEPA
jgi:ATP-dependent Clp protease adaptor protein ClpS